jgi:hypothetical protein
MNIGLIIARKAVVSMITGGGNDAEKSSKAAALRQAQLAKQQEAVQARARLREDNRETEVSADLASQRRAIAARRRGGQLAYAGLDSGLKTTFGG